MTFLLILLAVTMAALVWVLSSPARIATTAGMAFAAHPHLTVWLTAVLALCTLGIAAVLVYRNIAGTGWRLVTVTYGPVETWEARRHG